MVENFYHLSRVGFWNQGEWEMIKIFWKNSKSMRCLMVEIVYQNIFLCITYGRWYLPFAIYCLPTDLSNKDPVYQFEPNIATEILSQLCKPTCERRCHSWRGPTRSKMPHLQWLDQHGSESILIVCHFLRNFKLRLLPRWTKNLLTWFHMVFSSWLMVESVWHMVETFYHMQWIGIYFGRQFLP